MFDEEPTPDAAASSTECSVTADELAAYLRRRSRIRPSSASLRLQVVPGGRSKETILVTLDGTTELPTEVIVRKDRPVGLLDDKGVRRVRHPRAVYDHGGVPVARPFFADDAKNSDRPTLADDGAPCWSWSGCRAQKAGEYFPDLAAPPTSTGAPSGRSWRPPWPICTRCRSTRWPGRASTWPRR